MLAPLNIPPRVLFNNCILEFTGMGPGGRVRWHNLDNDSIIYLSPQEINERFSNGSMKPKWAPRKVDNDSYGSSKQPQIDIHSLCEKDKLVFDLRSDYVLAVEQAEKKRVDNWGVDVENAIKRVCACRGDARAPSTRSVYRWYDAYKKSGGQLWVLAPVRGGNTDPRLDPEVRHLILDAIEEVYLTTERQSKANTHGKVKELVDDVNKVRRFKKLPLLDIPSYDAVCRFINSLDRYEVALARYGRVYADREFRIWTKAAVPEAVLDCVQIDHTLLDINVSISGILVGRPWLTLAIDVYSRCILGYVIGFTPPSYATVMDCLARCILDKSGLLRRFGERGWVYPMRGIPKMILVDNGAEFRGLDLDLACKALKIDLEFTPPASAWFKAQVERHLGTITRSTAAKLPGRVLKTREDRQLVSDGRNIPIEELESVLVQWITTIYHRGPHKGLGNSPFNFWSKSVSNQPVLIPHSDDEVRLRLGRFLDRTLYKGGIHAFGELYAGPNYLDLRRRFGVGTRVRIKYNPWELGTIYVEDPDLTGHYIDLTCINTALKGVSLHEHKLTRSLARHICKDLSEDATYLEASRCLRQRLAEMSDDEKLLTSRDFLRLHDVSCVSLDQYAAALQEPVGDSLEPPLQAFKIIQSEDEKPYLEAPANEEVPLSPEQSKPTPDESLSSPATKAGRPRKAAAPADPLAPLGTADLMKTSSEVSIDDLDAALAKLELA